MRKELAKVDENFEKKIEAVHEIAERLRKVDESFKSQNTADNKKIYKLIDESRLQLQLYINSVQLTNSECDKICDPMVTEYN